MKARIITERVPNPYHRRYHMPVEVSAYHIHNFHRPLRDSSEKYLEDLGQCGRQIVEEVMKLDGVTAVTIQPYEVSVSIGEAFEWEDIHPHVIMILKGMVVQKCEVSEDAVEVTEKYDASKWGGSFERDPDFDDHFNDDENKSSAVAEDDKL